MVLKPSEIAPFNAAIFAEVMHAAGDTVYGLAAYVQSGDLSHARAIARHLRAGQVHLNYPELGHGGALWRLQAVGQWPRVRRMGYPRFSGSQSHRWLRPFGMTS
jgi:acyl-CoA reductase-like NAD-dependent aldehyde dehydrogenase